MKMKRISTILLALLMLISFTACNLDNNGILSKGPNRTPADNKNRNYIGHTNDTVYFVTSDGLSLAKLTGDTLTDDKVISADDIFFQQYQNHGWMTGNDIVYLEDDNNPENQAYHLVIPSNDNVSITRNFSPSGMEETPVFLYRYYDGDSTPYIVAKTANDSAGAVYSSAVNAEQKTITFSKVFSIQSYVGSKDGLLWNETVDQDSNTKEYSFYYAYHQNDAAGPIPSIVSFYRIVDGENEGEQTKESVTVDPNSIKSVAEKNGYIFVMTSSSNQITLYSNYNVSSSGVSGSSTTSNGFASVELKELASITDTSSSPFPVFIDWTNKQIVFLVKNYSDPSELYFVDLDGIDDTLSVSLSSRIEAEAFIDFTVDNDSNTIYMMTKDHGFYRIKLSEHSVKEA